ncbi:uncharacterized protein [Typha latifolia]|uniref:uncharacterized protein isoform X2 n=1 Tax=Typha latifolia TaxID=4733 RepID=UPI003C2F1746
MSGGFFRGTSADQDTRFSNKQAKLLKTQKFAAELDHLVDMTKVKIDVIRPWIATRSTELLGFEDEVLINFVYGLLDGKEVDGKQIQIQLTGFMEKNTGKFMKELWSLLLSAQKNASGVPQQFLDAKEQETLKRKVENDRITQEIQKRREEGKEVEQQRPRRMDEESDNPRSSEAAVPTSATKDSNTHLDKERKVNRRHGSRSKNRHSGSPSSDDHTPLRREGHKSRSVSVSPHFQKRSVSPRRRSRSPTRWSQSSDRRYRSPRRSISPRRHSPRNNKSPMRRTSARARRSSPSISRNRSPSPFRRRYPYAQRKSPSYLHRRSPPVWRRPPSHAPGRSPSPTTHKSPVRQRSLSSASRGSLSPTRDMSPSPMRRRSPILARRRSPSPLRRSPQPGSPEYRKRSHVPSPRSRAANPRIFPRERRTRSPYNSRSPRRPSRSRLSGEPDRHTNGDHRSRDESMSQKSQERRSSAYHTDDRPSEKHKTSEFITQKMPITLRSPQRDSIDEKDIHNRKHSLPSELSPNLPESPTCLEKFPRDNSNQKKFVHQPSESSEEHGSRRRKEESHSREGAYGRNQSVNVGKQSYSKELEYEKGSVRKNVDSDSEESEIHEDHGMEKGRHKRSNKHKRHLDDISGSDSGRDDKAKKRRRKEERRLRKEEKQRRREERHHRKLERHASKQKLKPVDTVTPPSDLEEKYHTNESDGEDVIRKGSSINDAEGRKLDHKRLEVELREKALESLRAKKSSY